MRFGNVGERRPKRALELAHGGISEQALWGRVRNASKLCSGRNCADVFTTTFSTSKLAKLLFQV